MNKVRMIYLSQLFDPEPTFKGLSFIKALSNLGYEIEVVTGFPNYPGGTVYDGYKIRLIARERMEGIQVTRLPVYPSHDRNPLKRIVNYLSFVISSSFYLLFYAKRSDLVYVFYPSLTAGLSAIFAKFFRSTPVILDIQDMWPDSIGASGMVRNKFLLNFVDLLCRFLYRKCDHIIVLSSGFRRVLIERGVCSSKISVIHNWAEETILPKRIPLPKSFCDKDKYRILFSGNIGTAQGLETIVQAALIVSQKEPGCTFYFLGDGVEKKRLIELVKNLNLSNVRFLPRVPLTEVQTFMAKADALLIHLLDDPLFKITIPSKTQSYLYSGRPILIGVRGDAADLVKGANAGLVFRPSDPLDLSEKVLKLLNLSAEQRNKMGANGKHFYETKLSRDIGIKKVAKILDRFSRNSQTLRKGDM